MSLEDAACQGYDPRTFDVHRFPEAAEALAVCLLCHEQQACLKRVRPQRSGFDGVAGGAVWRNGYRVRLNNTTREDRLLAQQQRGDE